MLKSSSLEAVKSDETTIISRSVYIEGKVTCDGNIIVDGRIKGEVSSRSNVNVGEGGEVNGSINAGTITIGGNVMGTVNAKEKLSMSPNGVLKGDIVTKVLVIEAGAKFEGNVKMGDSKYTPEIKQINNTQEKVK